MTKTEEIEETEIEATIKEMAASTAENIDLIDNMTDALLLERPDLQEIVVERVHIIKSGLIDQYFAAAFYEEPTPESEVPSRAWQKQEAKDIGESLPESKDAPDPESTERR